MLEEVGERRGVTRTPLFHFARADRHKLGAGLNDSKVYGRGAGSGVTGDGG